MRISIISVILTLSVLPVFGQRQFSVVCNTQTQTLEVIIMGEEQGFHRVLRENFPNQRAAQAYLSEHAATLPCGTRQQTPAVPPPVAAPPANSQPTHTPVAQTSGAPRRGAPNYDRVFRMEGSLSLLPNLKNLYGSSAETVDQLAGFDLGFDLTFGQNVKGGVGLHYTGLYGVFEEMIIDQYGNYDETYGYLRAARGDLLLRAPFRLGRNTWGFLDYAFSYYFATDLGIEKEAAAMLTPAINDGFFGMQWRVGFDINRFIIQAGSELIMGISEDFDGNLVVLRIGMGFAF